MKLLSDYVSSDGSGVKSRIRSKEWNKLRSACIEFETKFGIRLWTVVEENCFETPTHLMTKDLYKLLIPKGNKIKRFVKEFEEKLNE